MLGIAQLNEIRFKSEVSEVSEVAFPQLFRLSNFSGGSKHIMGDPYYSDEYEDYDDYDYCDDRYQYGSETSYSCELRKAENGQLYLYEGWLTRYPGEDWGEASGYSDRSLSLNELRPHVKKLAIKFGRHLKPGEDMSFYWWNYDEDEETEDQTDAGYIPF